MCGSSRWRTAERFMIDDRYHLRRNPEFRGGRAEMSMRDQERPQSTQRNVAWSTAETTRTSQQVMLLCLLVLGEFNQVTGTIIRLFMLVAVL